MDFFSYIASLILVGNQMTIDKNQMIIERHSEVIDQLIWCESRGIENAINPSDGDGTDSVGVLQFKWKTFSYFAQKYNLFPLADEADMQNLWRDKWAQKLVAATMMENEKNWKSHWKICGSKLTNK